MNNGRTMQSEMNEELPVAQNENVEFSETLADEDDREAQERARAADQRQAGDRS